MNYLLNVGVLFTCLLVMGCSTPKIKPSSGLHDNFSLAIYDSNNFLISDPIGDLKKHTDYHDLLYLCHLVKDKDITDLAYRKGITGLTKFNNIIACDDKHNKSPITDVYVISHGWNYTLEESISLYNDYILNIGNETFGCSTSAENELCTKHHTHENNKPFHPYYIFVSWPSTVRPISQTLKAVLPYSIAGSNSALGQISKKIDEVIFHLPTVWKQSLNTHLNSKTPSNGSDIRVIEVSNNQEQQEKIQKFKEEFFSKKEECSVLLLHSTTDPNKWTLAGFNKNGEFKHILINNPNNDGLVDWLYDESMIQDLVSSNLDRNLNNCYYGDYYHTHQKKQNKNIPFSIVLYELIKYRDKLPSKPKIHLIGHSYGTKLLTLSALNALKLWSKDKSLHKDYFKRPEERVDSPIESLLLFNAAFEPWELEDLFGFGNNNSSNEISSQDYFKFIPRKAFVYSNFDYPNGMIFDVSQVVISNTLLKNYSDFLEFSRDRYHKIFSKDDFTKNGYAIYSKTVVDPFSSLYFLGGTLVYSPLEWTFRKIVNLPFDYWYHIKQNDTIPKQTNIQLEILRQSFNGLHFFYL